MLGAIADLIESLRTPTTREVFFRSLRFNRRVLLGYASRLVRNDSRVETPEKLKQIDLQRRKGQSFTFICNHLSYADSHVIETLMIRSKAKALAHRLIHIAGQKTFQIWRRPMTRSLNTVRVYQAKAKVDPAIRRKMNSRALKWSAYMKRRGYALLVFPEGTRSRQQGRFNLNSANPKTTIYFRGSLVVPLGLMGSEKILPLGKLRPRAATILMRVGEPIDHEALVADYRAKNPDKTERQMRTDLMLYYMKRINELVNSEYSASPQ